MKVEIGNLVTVKSYSLFRGVSTTSVYGWELEGKVVGIRIDGILFICLGEEERVEYDRYRERLGIK